MHRSSYEIDHFSSYVLASQSWYRMFACLGSERAASTSWRVAGDAGGTVGTASDRTAAVPVSGSVLSVVMRSPSGTASAADDLRLAGALLEEAGHPDLLVLGTEQSGEQRGLEPEAVGEAHVQAVIHRLLGGPERDRRTVDELPRECHGLGVHVVRRDDLVDEADLECLGSPHVPPGEDQVLGLRRPDEAGQALRAAGARDDAEQDLRLADAGIVAGDTEVGGHREVEPTPQGINGDGRGNPPRGAREPPGGGLPPPRRGRRGPG